MNLQIIETPHYHLQQVLKEDFKVFEKIKVGRFVKSAHVYCMLIV